MTNRPSGSARARAASRTEARAPLIRTARLSGPSRPLDRRVHAVREDLADIALADQVVAPHFAEAVATTVAVPHAVLRGRPDGSASAISELLFGETFRVFEFGGRWAWGQADHDSYVGYLDAALLTQGAAEATHRIAAPQGLVFSDADIKSPVVSTLPLGARVAVTGRDGNFHALATGGFVHDRHIGPLVPAGGDHVAVAMSFIGTPYRWGGRTRAGIDCSGLVQQALMACGIACPRDSDQQREGLGHRVDVSNLKRGDLVYFPGHVGIMADASNLLHANAHWMATVIEPLADVVARATAETPILAVKRV